jgi:hypothetical protein
VSTDTWTYFAFCYAITVPEVQRIALFSGTRSAGFRGAPVSAVPRCPTRRHRRAG